MITVEERPAKQKDAVLEASTLAALVVAGIEWDHGPLTTASAGGAPIVFLVHPSVKTLYGRAVDGCVIIGFDPGVIVAGERHAAILVTTDDQETAFARMERHAAFLGIALNVLRD